MGDLPPQLPGRRPQRAPAHANFVFGSRTERCRKIRYTVVLTPLQEVIESGQLARGPWAGSPEDEAAVAEETGARLLCFPLAQPASLWGGFHTCLYSGYQAAEVALFGRPL